MRGHKTAFPRRSPRQQIRSRRRQRSATRLILKKGAPPHSWRRVRSLRHEGEKQEKASELPLFLRGLLRVPLSQRVGAAWLQLRGVSPEAGFAPFAFLDVLAKLFEIRAAGVF